MAELEDRLIPLLTLVVLSMILTPYVGLALLDNVIVSTTISGNKLLLSSYYLDVTVSGEGVEEVAVRGQNGERLVLADNTTLLRPLTPILPLKPGGSILDNMFRGNWTLSYYSSDGYKAVASISASVGMLEVEETITLYSWKPVIEVVLSVTNTANESIPLEGNSTLGLALSLKRPQNVDKWILAYSFLEEGKTMVESSSSERFTSFIPSLQAAGVIGGNELVAGISLVEASNATLFFERGFNESNNTIALAVILHGATKIPPSDTMSVEFTVVYGSLSPIYAVQDDMFPLISSAIDLNEGVKGLVDFQSRIENLNSTIKSLRETVSSLREDLDKLKAENEELKGAVDYWKTEYDVLKEGMGANNRGQSLVPVAFIVGVALGVVGGAIAVRILKKGY